jgi:hypothetical protein
MVKEREREDAGPNQQLTEERQLFGAREGIRQLERIRLKREWIF